LIFSFGQKVGEAPMAFGVAFAVVVFLIANELFRRPVA